MRTSENNLYSGPDLENAARLSARSGYGARLSGMTNAAGLLFGRAAGYLRKADDAPIKAVTSQVRVPGTAESLEAAYVGRGSNQAWLMSGLFELEHEDSTVLTDSPGSLAEQVARITADADILFIEDVPKSRLAQCQINFIAMPAWLKQRVPVLQDWQQQLNSMRRSTRREVARLLRKYRFSCRITRDENDFSGFYNDLYRPYIRSRHGDAAEIVTKELFLKECRKGVVLQLVDGNDVVGASLARPTGAAMAIVWTGMQSGPDDKPLPGASEILDYFCLLHSHTQGSRWLDLGPSRPDLTDGTLRYKARWNAQLHEGFIRPSEIHWAMLKPKPSFARLLTEHAFVTRTGQGLVGTLVTNTTACRQEQLQALIDRYAVPGLAHYQINALGAASTPKTTFSDRQDRHVMLSQVDDVDQLIATYSNPVRAI